MGHSMGGFVTINLLLAEPGLATRSVLVDVGPEIAEDGVHQIREFIQGTAEFDSLDDFIERVAVYDPYRTREHIARTARYNLMRRPDGKFVSKHDRRRRLLQTGAIQAPRPSLLDVAAITCPVLVVRGGESRVLAAPAAERFAAALPHGQLVTVPACGHNVHSQNTSGFLAAVLPFLSQLPNSASTR